MIVIVHLKVSNQALKLSFPLTLLSLHRHSANHQHAAAVAARVHQHVVALAARVRHHAAVKAVRVLSRQSKF